jgi:hypothetical protein
MEANRLAPLPRGLLSLAALGLMASACFGGGDEGDGEGPPSTPAADATAAPTGFVTPEDALQVFVERLLNRYFSGDCAAASRPDDMGKVCYSLRGERGNARAYDLGPTFSEPTMLAILRREPEGWAFVTVENVDPTAPVIPGIPWPVEIGERLIVAGTGDCLRAREAPGLDAAVSTCLPDGTEVIVQEGPQEADGHTWWLLAGHGWAAADWLRYAEEPLPEAQTPTASPTATPEE